MPWDEGTHQGRVVQSLINAGVHMKTIFWELAFYYGLKANISFTFQAVKNLYAHNTSLCFGLFCKFFGDF